MITNASRTKKVVYLTIIMFLFGLSQLIVNIFLARVLTKTDFGIYRTIFLYYTILSTFFTYSISPSILYFFSKHPSSKNVYLTSSFVLLMISGLFVAVCFFVLSLFNYGELNDNYMKLFFRVYAVYSAFSISSAFYIQQLIAENRFKNLTQYTSFIIILRVFNLVFVVLQTKNLLFILYTMCAIEVIHFMFVYVSSRKELVFSSVQKSYLREIAFYSFPIALATLLNTLSSEGSKLVITWLTTKEAFAVFAVGSTEIPLLRTITFSAGNVILPDVTRLYLSGEFDQIIKIWRSSVLKLSLLLIPITMFLYFHAVDIITILFSSKYLESTRIFKFYIMVIPLEIFLYAFFFRAVGKVKYIYYSSVILTTGTFLFTFFSLKTFGIVGVAVTRVLLMYGYVAIQISWISKTLNTRFYHLISLKDLLLVFLLSFIPGYISALPKIFPKEIINFSFQGILFVSIYLLIISFTRYRNYLPLKLQRILTTRFHPVK